MTWVDFLLAGLAAIAAGLVNALAGGGTLITFPTLTALGIQDLVANMTNTVALCPGYVGGIMGQWKDIKDQGKRLWLVVPAGVIGGLIGGYLLLNTGEKLFRSLVPFLILIASALLAIQDPVRAWLVKRASQKKSTPNQQWAVSIPIGLAAIYGGYFGAGLSVIVLSVLGLTIDDTLTRLNALKQAVSFSANFAAAIFFVFSGKVLWPVALVMAVGALIGGNLGGRLAGRVKPATLRWIVVSLGVIVSIIYFVRG
jgi:uncharacterized membrane protein YfcA